MDTTEASDKFVVVTKFEPKGYAKSTLGKKQQEWKPSELRFDMTLEQSKGPAIQDFFK